MRARPRLSSLPTVALAYTLITLVMTWPLARHPAATIAADLGDPAFNCWVLMWTAGVVLRAAKGDVAALHQFWNGNIFYPAPLTLAYSEHLTPQMLQMLPVYAAGGNILLCYNLLFLSTFVVAGVGMFVFVRDLTGRPLAAFAAGLAFAFAPYRIGQFSHLQVLSTGWMPLAFVGLRRYLVTRRTRPLVGGAAALAAQGLSCGYFLAFFPPFAAAYCLYEMTRRRLLGDRRVWTGLTLAAVGTAIVVAPFVWPYVRLNRQGDGVGVRSIGDVEMFSADARDFVTASPAARVLDRVLPGQRKAEGEGFPGFTILALAALAVGAAVRRAAHDTARSSAPLWTRALFWALALALLACVGEALWILVNGQFAFEAFGTTSVVRNVMPPLWRSGVVLAGLAALMWAVRSAAAPPDEGAAGFYLVAAMVAAVLAFGPDLHAAGHLVGRGPYGWLFAHVPGFDGLRVPARFLTIVTLFVAVLAGLGAAVLLAASRARTGRVLVVAACAGILLEAWVAPMPVGVPVVPDNLAPPPALTAGRGIGPLYRLIERLPGRVVLVEFPFGETAYEIQATYYAGYHRRPILNGYPGYFPPSYLQREPILSAAPANPAGVRDVLSAAGATHALVHEAAFRDGRGEALSSWLRSIGARLVAEDGTDRLFALPAASGAARASGPDRH